MPSVGKVGVSTAGGIITGPGAPTVLVEGVPIACVLDDVAFHGVVPHDFAFIVQGSTTVKAEGKPVTFVGCLASCGHAVAGASTVRCT